MSKSITEDLEPLFNPKSVAVVGATNNWNKWGFSTFNSALDGFAGPVYPVNSREPEVLGHKAYTRVTDIPEPVDMAIFVIPAPNVASVMEDCVAKGVKAAVIISAGFAETGPEGKKMQDEVLRIAQKGNIRFVGPNCMGMWSASSELRAFMMPLAVRDGRIALVSQGGNVGGFIVMSGYDIGLGFHRYISCGCTADIQIEDYIEHFGEDPKVEVILAYIEGLSHGERFLEKVRKVTAKKPVIILKPGKTEAAAKAIRSHSGALSGSNQAYDAAFRSIGVIRAENPEEMVDLAIGFLTQPLPRGRNVAILTPGGSYGVICADECASAGLNVLTLPKKVIAELDKVFPPRWSHGNPVDPAGDRNFLSYLTAPEKLLSVEEVDSLIFMGLGGFSIFAPMIFSQRSGSLPNLASLSGSSSSYKETGRILNGAIASKDTSKIATIIRPAVEAFSTMLNMHNKEEIEALTSLMSRAIAAGRINPMAIVRTFQQAGSEAPTGTAVDWRQALVEASTNFVTALAEQLVADYGKPVISTTSGVDSCKLRGSHYSFPSSRQASLVLAKMVEYREYLERVGAYKA
jgi:acyl-CoA synthetase (NDP forming)